MFFFPTFPAVGVWLCWKKACYTYDLKQRDQFILQRDLMLSIKSSPAVTLIPNISLYLINNSKHLCHVLVTIYTVVNVDSGSSTPYFPRPSISGDD